MTIVRLSLMPPCSIMNDLVVWYLDDMYCVFYRNIDMFMGLFESRPWFSLNWAFVTKPPRKIRIHTALLFMIEQRQAEISRVSIYVKRISLSLSLSLSQPNHHHHYMQRRRTVLESNPPRGNWYCTYGHTCTRYILVYARLHHPPTPYWRHPPALHWRLKPATQILRPRFMSGICTVLFVIACQSNPAMHDCGQMHTWSQRETQRERAWNLLGLVSGCLIVLLVERRASKQTPRAGLVSADVFEFSIASAQKKIITVPILEQPTTVGWSGAIGVIQGRQTDCNEPCRTELRRTGNKQASQHDRIRVAIAIAIAITVRC